VRRRRKNDRTGKLLKVLEQFRNAYDIHLWLRCLAWLGLISVFYMLLRGSGGFPPQVCIFLVRIAPEVPRLFVLRGPGVLLPLVALVALSLAWLVIWGVLLWTSIAVVRYEWYYRHSRLNQHLQHDQQAEAISWMPSHQRSGNHASNQLSNLQEASFGPFEYAEAQKAPAVTTLKAKHSPGMNVGDVGIGWDAGIVRRFKPNEDNLVAMRTTCTHNDRLLPLDLYVVADGMGGHSQGQAASRLAIHCMMQSVLPDILSSDQVSDEFIIETLVDGVEWANQAVHESSQTNGTEMGTTITAALVFNGNAYVVNVGDSRTYLYRESEGLSQVTRDHSLVARLVETGAITRDEVYTHPQRNKVYRGLGEKGEVKVDWFTLPVQAGDCLVLCSDGLWEMVRDQEIERIMKKYAANPLQASSLLIKAAMQGGGSDNISVIVTRIT
jgi:serine/threonine protein phosphatase PrpC